MIIHVSPENTQDVNIQDVEVHVEKTEVPSLGHGSQLFSLPMPLMAIAKGISWGLGLLSFAGAGLLLANRLKLRQELKKSDLQSMQDFNLEKFVGSWYEIAKFPHRGNAPKVGVMVNYQIIDPLTLKEDYLYQEGDFGSTIIEHSNMLHLVDPAQPARMQKGHMGPLAMNYWVLAVGAEDAGADYNYAVIGTPDRQHLWILSRTHQLSPDKYEALTHRLKQQGFAVQDLIRVPHHGISVGETVKPVIDSAISNRGLPPTPRNVPHEN